MSPNKIELIEATKKEFKRLKEIGMACYDVTVDSKRENFLARLLFLRYFSKRKFKERLYQEVLIVYLKVDDEIVGFYELEKTGNLASLYVMPDCHKKGYGRVLLENALFRAKELQMKEITLESSQHAHDFYLHMGFKDSQKAKVVLGVWMTPMKFKIL